MLLAAVEKGSFSAAAREMRIPVQTFSRKISDLELMLGTQLLTRTTRSLVLTDAGIAYAAAARRIVEQVEEAEREAAGEFVTPKGDLIITASPTFGRRHVLPIVSDFLALFPKIDVKLILTDRNMSLRDEQIDMAVRIGTLPDSGLIATRVGSVRGVICGTPGLLANHGVPQTPEDLQRMPCVMPDGPAVTAGWRFRHPTTGRDFEVPISPRLVTSAEAAADAALGGVGLSRSLHYQVRDGLQAGKLSIVLAKYELEPFPVHLVHAARGQLPLKMRRFLDFAAPRLRAVLDEVNEVASRATIPES